MRLTIHEVIFSVDKSRNIKNADPSKEFSRTYILTEYPGHSEIFGGLDFLTRRKYKKVIDDIKKLKVGYYKIDVGEYTYTVQIE